MGLPTTRNMSSAIEQIDAKFEELRGNLVSDLKKDLFDHLKEELLCDIKKFLTDQSLLIKDLNDTVTKHTSTISVLQNSVETLINENASLKSKIENEKRAHEATNLKLSESIDNLEIYSRRQCLRIDGVKVGDSDETSEKVVEIVHNLIKEVGIKTSDMVIDRAHRIGPVIVNKNNDRVRSIIVKFVNFRVRTLFYEKRKDLDNEIKIRIDLTKKKYELLKATRELIQNRVNSRYRKDTFVFSDINCRLQIVDKSSNEKAFISSIDDANMFLTQS